MEQHSLVVTTLIEWQAACTIQGWIRRRQASAIRDRPQRQHFSTFQDVNNNAGGSVLCNTGISSIPGGTSKVPSDKRELVSMGERLSSIQFTLGNCNSFLLSFSFVAFKNKSGHLANNRRRRLQKLYDTESRDDEAKHHL